MIGIEDPWVVAAYFLCIASALFCLVWGIAKWNKEDPDDEPEAEIRHWAEEEEKLEDEL